MFQMINLRNFFEIRNSSTRSFCRLVRSVSFKPHSLTPFIEFSIAEVAEMRFSMASSHMAWRDMMKFMAKMDPNKDTAPRMTGLTLIPPNTRWERD